MFTYIKKSFFPFLKNSLSRVSKMIEQDQHKLANKVLFTYFLFKLLLIIILTLEFGIFNYHCEYSMLYLFFIISFSLLMIFTWINIFENKFLIKFISNFKDNDDNSFTFLTNIFDIMIIICSTLIIVGCQQKEFAIKFGIFMLNLIIYPVYSLAEHHIVIKIFSDDK